MVSVRYAKGSEMRFFSPKSSLFDLMTLPITKSKWFQYLESNNLSFKTNYRNVSPHLSKAPEGSCPLSRWVSLGEDLAVSSGQTQAVGWDWMGRWTEAWRQLEVRREEQDCQDQAHVQPSASLSPGRCWSYVCVRFKNKASSVQLLIFHSA
jgi:hypothetical protein